MEESGLQLFDDVMETHLYSGNLGNPIKTDFGKYMFDVAIIDGEERLGMKGFGRGEITDWIYRAQKKGRCVGGFSYSVDGRSFLIEYNIHGRMVTEQIGFLKRTAVQSVEGPVELIVRELQCNPNITEEEIKEMKEFFAGSIDKILEGA